MIHTEGTGISSLNLYLTHVIILQLRIGQFSFDGAFPAPLTDVTMDLELNASTIPDRIHYLEASARSANGIWSHISRGTFFSYSFAPPNIKALEYYFEDESEAAGPLLTVNNFTPSRNVTLDSAGSLLRGNFCLSKPIFIQLMHRF